MRWRRMLKLVPSVGAIGWLLVLALMGLVLATAALPAEAQGPSTIVVDSTDDRSDADLDDGSCRTSVGTCSLRAAIEHANRTNGPNTIAFAIPGNGVQRIQLGSSLPTINDSTGPTTIDGYSQSGAAANTAEAGSNADIRIEVTGPTDGTMVKIGSPANVVQGLATYGARIQFLIEGTAANGNRILGNFIGTNAAGDYENPIGVGGGDTGVGVLLQLGASQNAIGAPNLGDRNIISGNGGYGLRINHGESHENLVQNNVVGLNPDLSDKLRQWHGIDLQWWTWGNLIGGNGQYEGNLVGGQINRGGIELSHDARGNKVIGNLVGTLGDGNTISSFSGNTYGITLKDFPRNNYIANNVVGGNDYGIWSKHNYTGINTFVGNKVGVGTNGGAIPNTTNVFFTGTDHIWYENVIANQEAKQFEVNNYIANQHFFYYDTYTHANRISQSQFYDVSSGGGGVSNVARQGTATQSSEAFGGAPGRAIDGNTNGVYNAGSITHTQTETRPWWQLDLGSEYPLTDIELFNRTDCCADRLSDFSLFVSSQPFGTRTFDELANDPSVWRHHVDSLSSSSIAIPVNRSGRYIRVQLEATNPLSLAEVVVNSPGTRLASVPPLDITPAGLNPNDPGDGDAGVQDLLNAPVVTGIGPGKVFGTACASCTVEVYVSGSLRSDGTLDTSGTAPGIGLAWIGTVTADGGGVFSMADPRIATGRALSALAIDGANNTSELPPGQIVPGTHSGVDGNAGPSQGPSPAPPVPSLPRLYDYSLGTISCSYGGGSLSWTDVGASSYQVWATSNGSESYLGAHVGTTLTTAVADSYRVAYLSSGQQFEGTCQGPDAGFSGRVTDLAGDGVADVHVDLFSEGRTTWLRGLDTDTDGGYRFDVDAGCYVVTFVAPSGTEFASGRFANRSVCAGDGEQNNDVDAQLLINGNANAPQIEASVTDRAGTAVAGVKVDLFRSDETRARISFLRSTTTDQAGMVSFTLDGPGCVVLTFAAPAGETFAQTGTEWLNQHRCLSDGEVDSTIVAVIDSGNDPGAAQAGGTVTDDGGPVADIKIDLFEAAADGSRGNFLRPTRTGADGSFAFTIDDPGCYVLTYIGPDGRTWTSTGAKWWNRAFCIAVGETIDDLDATLD